MWRCADALITYTVIQGSAIGPASQVVNAADLTTVTARNLMFKYADDTYIVIPVINANSRLAELDHLDQWAQNNNLRLNNATLAEIIFTNCKRKHTEDQPPQIPDIRRVTSIKILGVTVMNHLSVGEHVHAVISKCAQSLHALSHALDQAGDLISFWAHVNLLYRIISYSINTEHKS